MSKRYEIRDTKNPASKGMRFASLDRAERELSHAVPAGRFVIIDRETKEVVK